MRVYCGKREGAPGRSSKSDRLLTVSGSYFDESAHGLPNVYWEEWIMIASQ